MKNMVIILTDTQPTRMVGAYGKVGRVLKS